MKKSFDKKIILGIVIISLAFMPVLGSSIFSLYKVIKTQKVIEAYTEQLVMAGDLRRLKTYQLKLLPIYLLKGDRNILNEIEANNENFSNTLQSFRALTENESNKEILTNIETIHNEIAALRLPTIKRNHQNADDKMVKQYIQNITSPKSIIITSDLNKIIKNVSDAYEMERQKNNFASLQFFRTLILASGMTILLVILIGRIIYKIIDRKKRNDKKLEAAAIKERGISTARKETLEVVAHDLKNPLSSIMISSQLLLKNPPASTGNFDKNVSHVERILKSAHSMKRLIEDLLDHSKIESGNLSLSRRNNDLGVLLKTLYSRFEPLFKQKNIRTELNIHIGIPVVYIDEKRIEQVITNFISNSIKFTPPNGLIKIAAFYQAQSVHVIVSDSGSGMSKEQMSHIFERYWQVPETASKGTGLGLSISTAIAKAHGGSIAVESELKKGATFSLILPFDSNREFATQSL